MLERRIVAALETDARKRIAREPAATDRAAVVTRVDENVVGQLEQALDRGVEFFRRRLRATACVQVRTTDVAHEQRVTREDEPRFFRPSASVRDEVGVVRGCVSRSGERSYIGIPELDEFTVT